MGLNRGDWIWRFLTIATLATTRYAKWYPGNGYTRTHSPVLVFQLTSFSIRYLAEFELSYKASRGVRYPPFAYNVKIWLIARALNLNGVPNHNMSMNKARLWPLTNVLFINRTLREKCAPTYALWQACRLWLLCNLGDSSWATRELSCRCCHQGISQWMFPSLFEDGAHPVRSQLNWATYIDSQGSGTECQ